MNADTARLIRWMHGKGREQAQDELLLREPIDVDAVSRSLPSFTFHAATLRVELGGRTYRFHRSGDAWIVRRERA